MYFVGYWILLRYRFLILLALANTNTIMKKLSLISFILIYSASVFSQSLNGLVAHWMFNGNTADSSGNNLHGVSFNAMPAAGMNGQPNTAYYFNGTNAYISVPYDSKMNLSRYTIAVTLQVQQFNNSWCQASRILSRGSDYSNGNYSFQLTDNPFDNDDCNAFDSTNFIFHSEGTAKVTPSSQYQYTPTTISYKWYRAVLTFDSVTYKVYVDGKLMATAVSNAAPIGMSLDGLFIGSHYNNTYPTYRFNGLMDDMMLYDRALSFPEIATLGCDDFISLEPLDTVTFIGNNVPFTVSAGLNNVSYQWQVNTGNGFTNLTNSPGYIGFDSSVLTVVNPALTMDGNLYRCIVTNEVGCTDTSYAALLTVQDPAGINDQYGSSQFIVYPNPSRGTIAISGNGDYYVKISDLTGRTVFSTSTPMTGTTTLQLNLTQGIYLILIRDARSSYIETQKLLIH